MENAVHFVVKMPVPAENHAAFQALAQELIACSRQEAGNIYYYLAADKKEPDCLLFLECWKDREAIAFHNETAHFKRILPQLLKICNGNPIVKTYTQL